MGRTIAPGGRANIEASGWRGAAILATTNERDTNQHWLRGRPRKVLHAFRYSGDWDAEWRFARFEIARASGPQTRTVILARGDGGPIAPRVLAVERRHFPHIDRAPFNAQAVVREIAPGERYALEITLSPPWPNSGCPGELRLATGVPQQPTAELSLWLTVAPQRVQTRVTGAPVPRARSAIHELIYRFRWSDETPTVGPS
ncbi:MAG: hypothetical protein AB1716_00335 [Planctomycetota bacterium]